MRGVTPLGLWTSAGLYIAIGVIGVVWFSGQPQSASSTDGYGVIRVAAQSAQP